MTKQAVLVATISQLLLAGILAGQTSTSKLSARELYYNPVKKTSAAAKPGGRGRTPIAPSQGPAKGEPSPGATSESTAPTTDVALAMRYRLHKKIGSRFEEVDTDTSFNSGDFIRISVAVNAPAYVYIAQIGSSGKWNVLFPDDSPNANSVVKQYAEIELPGGGMGFRFDANPGVEQVFVAVSRQPINDLEQIISARKSQRPAPPVGPGVQKNPVMVSLPIDNSLIAGLRLQARDLVVQKVDAVSSGAQEHAVYIASAPDSNSDLVIADMKLNHQR